MHFKGEKKVKMLDKKLMIRGWRPTPISRPKPPLKPSK